jgi:hypothetical protein
MNYEMRKRDSLLVTGIALLVLWVSHVPYLFEFPLYRTAGSHRLSNEASDFPDWIKDESWLAGKSQSDIESELVKSARITFAKDLLLCLVGILSGFLVLKRHGLGRLLAIGLSIYLLLLRIVHIAVREHAVRIYGQLFSRHPFRAIHLDIVSPLVLLVILVHLLRPSIAKQFEKNES